MSVFLKKADLETKEGKELLELLLRIASKGRLDLDGIKELYRWLKVKKGDNSIESINYLVEIMSRITANRVISKDELKELHLVIEKVIPNQFRKPVVDARKKLETRKRELEKEKKLAEKEKKLAEKEQLKAEKQLAIQRERDARILERQKAEELRAAKYKRAHHSFTFVAGVSYANVDGSQRQQIIADCVDGEQLFIQHDRDNEYSEIAFGVFRSNGEQLGYVKDDFCDVIEDELSAGFKIFAWLTAKIGRTQEYPMLGAKILIVFAAQDISSDELNHYINSNC